MDLINGSQLLNLYMDMAPSQATGKTQSCHATLPLTSATPVADAQSYVGQSPVPIHVSPSLSLSLFFSCSLLFISLPLQGHLSPPPSLSPPPPFSLSLTHSHSHPLSLSCQPSPIRSPPPLLLFKSPLMLSSFPALCP